MILIRLSQKFKLIYYLKKEVFLNLENLKKRMEEKKSSGEVKINQESIDYFLQQMKVLRLLDQDETHFKETHWFFCKNPEKCFLCYKNQIVCKFQNGVWI